MMGACHKGRLNGKFYKKKNHRHNKLKILNQKNKLMNLKMSAMKPLKVARKL